MRNDLSELLDRVEFCRQRSQELQGRIAQLSKASIHYWRVPWQPGVGEIKAKLLAQPPVSLRQEVGMIVNEQRSILDALASKLAIRNGANDVRGVYFPITQTKVGFFEKVTQKKIEKLGQSDRESIEALKPWLAPYNEPENGNQLLYQLHEADIMRKHEDLLRWACLGGVYPSGKGQIGKLDTGKVTFIEKGREETLAFFAAVTCQLNVHFEMVYVEPATLAGHAVGPLLSNFNDVVDKIVRKFI